MSNNILDMDWEESTETLPVNAFICSSDESEEVQVCAEVLGHES